MVLTAGSRGDVQPLVALSLGLRAAGHQVTVAGPRDFRTLVEGYGLAFHGFPIETGTLLDSDLGRSWLGHSSQRPMLELRLLTQMVSTWGVALADEIVSLAGRADLFVSGVMSLQGIDALVRAAGGRHVLALLAPFAPSRAGWAGLQAPRPRAVSRQNSASTAVTNWLLAGAFRAPGAEVRRQLGLPRAGRRDFGRLLVQTPTLVGVSPAVLPRPADWPAHIDVTGYWFLDTLDGWAPPAGLTAFLGSGEPPVYVGFGSMSTHDREGTLDTILAALDRTGLRGIVHRGGARLHTDDLPPGVLLVDDVPHEWLFPRCSALVHHGGAGTTAAGLRAGVPSGVVAHMGDQPYWGRRVAELGAGARCLRRHELTADRLAGLLDTLTGSVPLAQGARVLGAAIRAEDGVGAAVAAIERFSAGDARSRSAH